ncbi:MAG: nucleoid-associated protein [Bacteroidetes bacterium]|nr:MAG: nucleoid-associated protein [Bacteroidota bacterium]
MIIDFSICNIVAMSVHEVGNKTNNGQIYASIQSLNIEDENLLSLLQHYFLKPFTQQEFWQFTSSNNDLGLNPVYTYANQIFSNHSGFHVQSINIAKQLYESTNHPNIKDGDLFVVLLNNVRLGEEMCDAVGVFKSEQKESFIKTNRKGKEYDLTADSGINIDKLDKGCIIFNLNEETGFKVAIIDKAGRGAEANYWKDDFLQLKTCADDYNFTRNFLGVTKAYVTQQLQEEFEVTKADQIDLLNKSVNYFKENERFVAEDFAATVFEDKSVIQSFQQFKSNMQHDADLDLADGFDINIQAVKKQAKVFKSVLKLDKNFHIYIHGNRNLIERGEDESGKKYYKIYFDKEE